MQNTGVGLLFGFTWQVAFIGAAGFVLTSTAIVMQLLGDTIASNGTMSKSSNSKMATIFCPRG
jgi:glutathione-regulated potassium-efflux system protein KefB